MRYIITNPRAHGASRVGYAPSSGTITIVPHVKSDIIYAFNAGGLGDSWMCINSLVHKSSSVRVARWTFDKHRGRTDIRHKIEEIATVLNAHCEIEICDRKHTTPIWDWGTPYMPTKIQWRANNSKTICHQLGGVSCTWAPKDDITWFECWARANGWNAVHLGKHMSLLDNVKTMASSLLFVGVDSGMSHVAHSVGVPIHICEYEFKGPLVSKWSAYTRELHAGKQFQLHDNIKAFTRYLESMR